MGGSKDRDYVSGGFGLHTYSYRDKQREISVHDEDTLNQSSSSGKPKTTDEVIGSRKME